MKTLQASLWLAVASLAAAPLARAEDPPAPGYSRQGEISPNTQAPSLAQMLSVIQNGSPEKMRATLEYGEHVVCDACVPLLERNLTEHSVARVREMSAWWLRRQPFAGPAVLFRLRTRIKTESDALKRARLAEALGEFMDPHAVPELSDAATGDKDAGVRAAAVHAIGRLNNDTGFAVFADALADKDTGVKLAALDELARIGSFRDYDALIALLGDNSADVRTRAARLLGEYRVAAAETTLIAVLEGDDASSARKAAAWALGRIGGADGQSALIKALGSETEQGVLDAIRIAQRMR